MAQRLLKGGADVSRVIAPAWKDPDAAVREAVANVYNDIAVYKPEVPIPVNQILRVIDYPYADDRSRALALLLTREFSVAALGCFSPVWGLGGSGHSDGGGE